MKKVTVVIILVVLAVSVFSISNVYADSIPSWIKNTAKWWGNGQITDDEFIKAIQYLIDQKILIVSQSSQTQQTSSEGFSSTSCHKDEVTDKIVHMTGKFTNGATHYNTVYFTLGILDSSGTVVATGIGNVSDIDPYQTKTFDAEAIYSGDFAKCTIEIDTKY